MYLKGFQSKLFLWSKEVCTSKYLLPDFFFLIKINISQKLPVLNSPGPELESSLRLSTPGHLGQSPWSFGQAAPLAGRPKEKGSLTLTGGTTPESHKLKKLHSPSQSLSWAQFNRRNTFPASATNSLQNFQEFPAPPAASQLLSLSPSAHPSWVIHSSDSSNCVCLQAWHTLLTVTIQRILVTSLQEWHRLNLRRAEASVNFVQSWAPNPETRARNTGGAQEVFDD